MINLSQIENATKEDRESGLYDWVSLFRAREWKELMELSKRSEALGNAVVTLAELSDDEKIRQQCEARRKYEMDQDALNKRFQNMTSEMEKMGQKIEEMGQLMEEKKQQMHEQERKMREQEQQLYLIEHLTAADKYEEIKKALEDKEYQRKLMKEYNVI